MYYINKNADNKYTLRGCVMYPHENGLQAKIVWMSDITKDTSNETHFDVYKSFLHNLEQDHWNRYWNIEKNWEKLD